MTTDIKKAWEQMKKEIKKELGISGGFTLNAKQLQNRTATYLSTVTLSYETAIAFLEKEIERVQGYTTWTDAEKENSRQRELAEIQRLEALRSRYGTRENQVVEEMKAITGSKAFEKFENAVGKTSFHIEENNGCYYIRFDY